MRHGFLLVVAALTAAGFAGCLGSDEPPAAANLDDNRSDAETATADLPDGRDGRISAFDETNRTEDGVGGTAHDHDYWKGRERVVIFQTTKKMHPLPRESGSTAEFRVPEPGLVFEGTGRIDFTITNPQRHACEPLIRFPYDYRCTSDDGLAVADPTPPDGLTLEFLHAAASDWETAGTLQWGTPLEVPIPDPRWTDMPHSTASLWLFRVVSPNPQDATLLFDASAEIVRSGNVPEWPGHPDFYGDSNVRKVCDACKGESRDAGPGGFMGERRAEHVTPEKLVSHGTGTLDVYVNVTDFQAPLEPDGWILEWHNATGSWKNFPAPAGADRYRWLVPVPPSGMDTPYAEESRWELRMRAVYADCVGGCAVYAVDYTMDVLATTAILPEDAYGLADGP